MSIQENLASIIRLMMENQKKSLTEFSEELEISRSMLQDYLRAEGNPCIATIEHLGKKLNVEPSVLLTGQVDGSSTEIILQLLGTIKEIAVLDETKKTRFAELLMEMVKLWNEKGKNP